jgi:hypothetical protein
MLKLVDRLDLDSSDFYVVWVRVPLLSKSSFFFMKKGFHPKKIKIYVRNNKGSVFIFKNHHQNYDYLLNLRKLLKGKNEN